MSIASILLASVLTTSPLVATLEAPTTSTKVKTEVQTELKKETKAPKEDKEGKEDKEENKKLQETINKILEGESIKPESFKYLMHSIPSVDSHMTARVNSEQAMLDFIKDLHTGLPTTARVSSSVYSSKELKKMYYDMSPMVNPDETPNQHGLSTYSARATGKTLYLKDISNEHYKANQIEKGVSAFVGMLAPTLKQETEKETILATYNYMFDNFTYNASGMRTMLVGNIGNGTIACNGFSYLADKLLEANGIKSEIRGGKDHFWNVITLEDGKQLTFDATSDVLLKKRYATLGQSTKDHITKVEPVQIYTAEYGENHTYAPVDANLGYQLTEEKPKEK